MTTLNVGNLDRLLRIVVGLALVAAAATGLVGAWGWIGVLPVLTGIVAWCPLYDVLRVRTTRR